ncbi:MAG: hypothetical protein ACRBCI_07580 [Cellvibrionaceae bacterium]
MNQAILILPAVILLVLQSCTTDNAGKKETVSPLIQGLTSSIDNTPYSARIQQNSIKRLVPNSDKNKKEGVEEYIIDASVLETYRGQKTDTVRYSVFVEKGESMSISEKALVVSLCIENGRYYWPGVGASFPVSDTVQMAAKKLAKTVNVSQQSFRDCEY